MPLSLLDQLLQIGPTGTINSAVSDVHTAGVAEGQTSLEGEQNVFRTLLKDLLGETNWYDLPDLSVSGIYNRRFIELHHAAGFLNVASGVGSSSTAWDAAIKALTGHNEGGGSSTESGVVVNATLAHRLSIRNASTQGAIDDGDGNEVYGRLSWDDEEDEYVISWFSNKAGTETAYTFDPSVNLDLAYVAMSRKYQEMPWERFLDFSFHDMAGVIGTVGHDAIVVSGMEYLFDGLTTQAQVNAKADKLGQANTNNEGAHLVAINDSATGGSDGYFTGGSVQSALNEFAAQIGGLTSNTFEFTENNVLTDNATVYGALEDLDLQWGKLSSEDTSEGASLVGIEDENDYFTGTTVEAALQELGLAVQGATPIKFFWTNDSVLTSGTPFTLPGSLEYTPDAGDHGQNMDFYFSGQLQRPGAGNDYLEASSTQITPQKTIPSGRNLCFVIRK